MQIRKEGNIMKKTNGINQYISITTLNVNGLSSPVRRYRLVDCATEQLASVCGKQEHTSTAYINIGIK